MLIHTYYIQCNSVSITDLHAQGKNLHSGSVTLHSNSKILMQVMLSVFHINCAVNVKY